MLSNYSLVGNEELSIHVGFLNENTPVVSSLDIAKHFQRKHKHVLEEIRKMQAICPKSFYGPNFRPIEIDVFLPHSGGIRKDPAYQLTRDGFSALVMGFTGKAALLWRIRYIEAFNALEAAILQNQSDEAYQRGLTEARSLPALEVQRKAAYLDGMKEGQRLQKRRDGLAQTEKALGYVGKGITLAEAARFVGCAESTLRGRVRRIRRALSACIRPVQGRLLEVPRG